MIGGIREVLLNRMNERIGDFINMRIKKVE